MEIMSEEKGMRSGREPGKSKLATAFEQADEERKRRLMASRFQVARSGIKAYETGDYKQAVQDFQTYIHIIEEAKSVEVGGLLPQHFDREREQPEVLMLCGVLWDLIKIYDRMSSAEKKADFLAYLNKYVLLSRGMNFEHISSESIRKYVSTGHGKNTNALNEAYASLVNSRCFIVTSLLDLTSLETLEALRTFRDQELRPLKGGQVLIQYYERTAPGLARILNQSPHCVRVTIALALGGMARVIQAYFNHFKARASKR